MVFTSFLWNCCIVSAHTCLCLTTWLYFIALSHYLKNSLRDFLAINSFCKKNIPLIIFMRFDDDLSAYAKHGFVYHKPALMMGVRIPLSTPLLMLRVPRIGWFHILCFIATDSQLPTDRDANLNWLWSIQVLLA